MKGIDWLRGERSEPQRWVDERFLRVACDAVAAEVDWDSLDAGCLHGATSHTTTLAGAPVIIGVLGQAERLSELLEDAEQDRNDNHLPADTPLWLYVPAELPVPPVLPERIVLKRVQ